MKDTNIDTNLNNSVVRKQRVESLIEQLESEENLYESVDKDDKDSSGGQWWFTITVTVASNNQIARRRLQKLIEQREFKDYEIQRTGPGNNQLQARLLNPSV